MGEVEVFTSDSQVKLMEIKNILDDAGIDYHEVNKLDSSYAGIFGEIQLFVSSVDADRAAMLIRENDNPTV